MKSWQRGVAGPATGYSPDRAVRFRGLQATNEKRPAGVLPGATATGYSLSGFYIMARKGANAASDRYCLRSELEAERTIIGAMLLAATNGDDECATTVFSGAAGPRLRRC